VSLSESRAAVTYKELNMCFDRLLHTHCHTELEFGHLITVLLEEKTNKHQNALRN